MCPQSELRGQTLICILLTGAAEALSAPAPQQWFNKSPQLLILCPVREDYVPKGNIANQLLSHIIPFPLLFMYSSDSAVFHTAFQWAVFHTPL